MALQAPSPLDASSLLALGFATCFFVVGEFVGDGSVVMRRVVAVGFGRTEIDVGRTEIDVGTGEEDKFSLTSISATEGNSSFRVSSIDPRPCGAARTCAMKRLAIAARSMMEFRIVSGKGDLSERMLCFGC